MPFAKYPVDTVVRLKKTGEFARITSLGLLMNRPESFLNYYVEIEGREPGSLWAMYEGDFEFECLPMEPEPPKEKRLKRFLIKNSWYTEKYTDKKTAQKLLSKRFLTDLVGAR